MKNLSPAPLRSLLVRLLARSWPNPAKERGLRVDLGASLRGWLRVPLVGFMSKTLPEVLGHPMEAVAFSRFGGFHRDMRFSDFQNPASPTYQCWIGAYIVFDNEYRQRFGLAPDGSASPQDALDALEADQRLVFRNAGIPNTFPDGRRTRLLGDCRQSRVEEAGQVWWRLTGDAETWSTYHRGKLPQERWQFGWCYGVVPAGLDHGVEDLHPLIYRGEFWVRYEEAWRASCCRFFVYPRYTDREGRVVDKGATELITAGRAALAKIRFRPG